VAEGSQHYGHLYGGTLKILLVNPPARSRRYESILVPPLGLLYVATYLKNAGYDVRIRDVFAEGMDWSDYAKYIEDEKPDILGIGGMTPVIDTTFKAIKMARPHCRHIIMGGPHLSLYRQQVFAQCPEVDFGVVGEGEETALELIRALHNGSSPDALEGVITRDGGNPDRKSALNINDLPIPDRSMLPNHLYRYPFSVHRHVTTMFSSRGCPYACTFCDKSTFGSTWRARCVDHVLAEIDEIIHRHGIKSIIFYDDLFTINQERVVGICEEILRRGYMIDWKCEGRVNQADLEVLKLMRRAGCSMIAYGVESANQSGLDYLNKNISTDQIEKAFRLTAQAGIRTMAYFILGIPVETYEDELKTIALAKRIKATYAQFSILSPYYGTKVYEDAVQKGMYREVDAKNPLDKDLKRPVILSDNWDEEKMQAILKAAHREFYLRPTYMVRLALSMRSVNQVVSYLRGLSNVISWLRIKQKS
jgi:anaerobic magnesium-protoporphyrin IX monomethyl ester cyclase